MELVCDYMHEDSLRQELNALTRRTFGFDFESWVQGGFCGEDYCPYSFREEGQIVANVSVNRMIFAQSGAEKHYFQLGTVMTEEKYRRRGLGRKLIEHVLERYEQVGDGVYLFGNLDALNFYRSMGFQELLQYAYTLKPGAVLLEGRPFRLVRKGPSALWERYEHAVQNGAAFSSLEQKNRYGLQMFYTAEGDNVWYSDELDCFAVLEEEKLEKEKKEDTLTLASMIGERKVPLAAVLSRLNLHGRPVRLGFSPLAEDAALFDAAPFDGGEDYRLFYRGAQLESIPQERLFFPLLSHA